MTTLFNQASLPFGSSKVHMFHGNIMAVVYWLNGMQNACKSKTCDTIEQANWFIVGMIGQIIKNQLFDFLNERELIIEALSERLNLKKEKDAIKELREMLRDSENDKLSILVQRVGIHRKYLEILLPPENTMHYEKWNTWLANLMLYCGQDADQLLESIQ